MVSSSRSRALSWPMAAPGSSRLTVCCVGAVSSSTYSMTTARLIAAPRPSAARDRSGPSAQVPEALQDVIELEPDARSRDGQGCFPQMGGGVLHAARSPVQVGQRYQLAGDVPWVAGGPGLSQPFRADVLGEGQVSSLDEPAGQDSAPVPGHPAGKAGDLLRPPLQFQGGVDVAREGRGDGEAVQRERLAVRVADLKGYGQATAAIFGRLGGPAQVRQRRRPAAEALRQSPRRSTVG